MLKQKTKNKYINCVKDGIINSGDTEDSCLNRESRKKHTVPISNKTLTGRKGYFTSVAMKEITRIKMP